MSELTRYRLGPARAAWYGAAVLVAALALPAHAEESIKTIGTPGSGELTMCRSWLLFRSCDDYHHIKIPKQVTVGDTLRIVFGSNPKFYNFPVGRIVVEGKICLLLSDPEGGTAQVDKIAIPCPPANP